MWELRNVICGSLAAEKANVAAHKSNPNGICIFAIELNRSGSEMRDALRGDYILKEFYEEVHDDKPPVVFHCAKLICQPYHRGSVIRYVREQWTSKQKRTWPRQYLRVPRKKQIQQTSSSNGNDPVIVDISDLLAATMKGTARWATVEQNAERKRSRFAQ